MAAVLAGRRDDPRPPVTGHDDACVRVDRARRDPRPGGVLRRHAVERGRGVEAGDRHAVDLDAGQCRVPDLSEDDTWIVTYEVSGVEDGPQINTIEVTGDTYSHDETELASTSSSSKKLTVKVTDVEKQGI